MSSVPTTRFGGTSRIAPGRIRTARPFGLYRCSPAGIRQLYSVMATRCSTDVPALPLNYTPIWPARRDSNPHLGRDRPCSPSGIRHSDPVHGDELVVKQPHALPTELPGRSRRRTRTADTEVQCSSTGIRRDVRMVVATRNGETAVLKLRSGGGVRTRISRPALRRSRRFTRRTCLWRM